MRIEIENKINRFATICLSSCKKLRAQIEKVKASITAEFRGIQNTREHLVQLALNEAEALAWQTPYPHLLFPTLAREKVQAVANWEAHQQFIRRNSPALQSADKLD